MKTEVLLYGLIRLRRSFGFLQTLLKRGILSAMTQEHGTYGKFPSPTTRVNAVNKKVAFLVYEAWIIKYEFKT